MHFMLRSLGPTWLLFASVGPASAMDPSAIEETNCLMACDANQEHCAGSPHVAPTNYSQARHSSPVNTARRLPAGGAYTNATPIRLSLRQATRQR
jgi:hypothetical protein